MRKIPTIHPFPARMAPELAINGLQELTQASLILDPMSGSGTVVRQAAEMGHRAIGFDMDPLAVLMTQVWTTLINDDLIESLAKQFIKQVKSLPYELELSWIDQDAETKAFTEFWFGELQRKELRRLSYVLNSWQSNEITVEQQAVLNVLKLALSRLIITKKKGASLAWDVSHSRPHKVVDASEYDVVSEFIQSLRHVRKLLSNNPPLGNVTAQLGDARFLKSIADGEVDMVLTSPPYLNAIDYMRGHRMALVWLGYKLTSLRHVRSNSIGAERSPDTVESIVTYRAIAQAMCQVGLLSKKHYNMVARYAEDLHKMMAEIQRVLNQNGKAILVIGNSCLKGEFIRNSDGIIEAGKRVGLRLANEIERDLPITSRYLPIPKGQDVPLGKRMRTETILTFAH